MSRPPVWYLGFELAAWVAFVVAGVVQHRAKGLQGDLLLNAALLAPLHVRRLGHALGAIAPPPLAFSALELVSLLGSAAESVPPWCTVLATLLCLAQAVPPARDEGFRVRAPLRLAGLGLLLLTLAVLFRDVARGCDFGLVRAALFVPPALVVVAVERSSVESWLARCAACLAVARTTEYLLNDSTILAVAAAVFVVVLLPAFGGASVLDGPRRLVPAGAAAVAIAALFGAGHVRDAPAAFRHLERAQAVLVASVFAVALGHGLGRRAADRSGSPSALVLLVYALGIPYAIARPPLYFGDIAAFLPIVAAAAVAGVVIALRFASDVPAWAGGIERAPGSLALCVLLPSLLALPRLLHEIVGHWNVTGFMDSQAYDQMAHTIAIGETPEGNSYYMPLYQYALGGLYWTLGHRNWIQQLGNLGLALTGLSALARAAWKLFERRSAVLVVGLLAGSTPELQHAIFYPAIENLYVPLVCASLLAWVVYLRRPGTGSLVWLGLAVGAALSTRTQGAFFYAVVILSPLAIRELPLKRRAAHVLGLGLLVGAALLPWSLRNLAVQGRFSPSSTQASTQMAILNDPRVGLYGIRYDIGYREVNEEYIRRFPDERERLEAMRREAWGKIFGDPARLVRAVAWRSLAFYGLLPPGIFAPKGPEPADWSRDGQTYLYWRVTPLVLIALSLCALVFRPSRTSGLLGLAMLGNLSVIVFVGFGEPRLAYPAYAVHLLLALHLCAAPVVASRTESVPDDRRPSWKGQALKVLLIALGGAALVGTARFAWGRPGARRSIATRAVDPALHIDPIVRELDRIPVAERPRALGTRVRVACIPTDYEFPPDWSGRPPWMPECAFEEERFRICHTREFILARFGGASSDAPLHEREQVEIEGVFRAYREGLAWIEVERVVHIGK